MKPFSDFLLTDWLDYLENRHQVEIQLGLTRVTQVADRLNVRLFNAQVITVAGTNGKGSTVAALEALYVAAGYQVASYTSPHLLAFNERIRINKQPITDEILCATFMRIEQIRGSIQLTYYEMATLAALYFFKQSLLDIIILEVGLGGRLDATNIIDANLSIITTVDLDHQAYLGDTKEAIGYEKAGILRRNRPFIYADNNPPESIVEKGYLLNAPMQCLGVNYFFNTTHDRLEILHKSGELIDLPLPRINVKAAVAAVLATECLFYVLPVTYSQQKEAMRIVSIIGRQQLLPGPVATLFDVAHNPQAVLLLVDFIEKYQPTGNVHAVFSGLKDKDLCGLIRLMRSCVDVWYPAVLDHKRAASESMLLDAFQAEAIVIQACFRTPLVAYRAAIERAKSGDLIVVYGSFLTVSAVMSKERAFRVRRR